MKTSIMRGGFVLGAWTDEEIRDFYREGRLVDTDCYWMEGSTRWIPLPSLLDLSPPSQARPESAPDPMIMQPPIGGKSYLQWSEELPDPVRSAPVPIITRDRIKYSGSRRLGYLCAALIMTSAFISFVTLTLRTPVKIESSPPVPLLRQANNSRGNSPEILIKPAIPASGPGRPPAIGIVHTDNAEAARYRASATAGDVEAARNLGILYLTGRGVPTDLNEALKWLQKAADQGDAVAQTDIGFMYENGQGVPKDYSQAIEWYQKAAKQGNHVAQTDIGFMYKNGQGVPQEYSEAFRWYQKAADQGDAGAQCVIGYMYENGLGVDQDYAQALQWYQRAADQGDDVAQTDIGFMYQNGLGVAKDYSQALQWYQKAADRGDAVAQADIGFMYENGRGVAKDSATAIKWYIKAAAQGQSDAQAALKRLN